ncbi:MAG: TRAP transporter large permease subunit [Candidatus Moduliflexus flocculans]|nr:TRAP transporter large permease subunit [Candidatus Moduliflexus flocculans]
MVMFPGMITGSSTASVLTSGPLVAPVLTKLGLSQLKTGAFIAMAAVLGMIAPPVNILVMIMGGGVDMPYVGVTLPLLVIVVPLAIVIPLWIGLRDIKVIAFEDMKAILPPSVYDKYGFRLLHPAPRRHRPDARGTGPGQGHARPRHSRDLPRREPARHGLRPALRFLEDDTQSGRGGHAHPGHPGRRGHVHPGDDADRGEGLDRHDLPGPAGRAPLRGHRPGHAGLRRHLGLRRELDPGRAVHPGPDQQERAHHRDRALGRRRPRRPHPPAALAGRFAGQVVGEKNFIRILRYCLVPALFVLAWAIVILLNASILDRFI